MKFAHLVALSLSLLVAPSVSLAAAVPRHNLPSNALTCRPRPTNLPVTDTPPSPPEVTPPADTPVISDPYPTDEPYTPPIISDPVTSPYVEPTPRIISDPVTSPYVDPTPPVVPPISDPYPTDEPHTPPVVSDPVTSPGVTDTPPAGGTSTCYSPGSLPTTTDPTTTEPTVPTGEPAEPTCESTEPTGEPTEPTGEPSPPTEVPTEPTIEPTPPTGEPTTEPTPEPTGGEPEPEPTTPPTPPPPPPPPPASLLKALFPPEYTYATGFTTADIPEDELPHGVVKAPLADKPLNVIKVAANLTHNVVEQDGKTAWEAFYPEGSYKPSATPRGGFGFYLGGTDAFKAAIDAGAPEVVTAYSVYFGEEWDWVKGGKLPGGFGGIGDSAFGCSGGRQEERQACFNLRLMWREEGKGELYAYLPLDEQNEAVLSAAPPESHVNPDFGISVGRGAWVFPRGEWLTVSERIKLNEIVDGEDKRDGEVQVWVNGVLKIDVKGLSLRNTTESVVQGSHFQTFFGGSTEDWATPKDVKAWFADVSGAVITGEAHHHRA